MADYSEKINVRQVTAVHANWSEEDSDVPGKFSMQLILDNGAEERVIRPTSEDADVLMDLLGADAEIYFDLANSVLVFRNVS